MTKQIILQLLAIAVIACHAPKSNAQMVHKNSDIEINFSGSFEEVENGSFNATIDKNYKGYFLNFEKKILFHEDDQEKYHSTDDGEIIATQHVVTSTGYLSDLYIYKAIEKDELLEEIDRAFGQKETKFSYRKVEEVKIGELKVLNWRTQYYKNRFEYYLVVGELYYYLFVSTPYGEKEYIETLLKTVRYLN
jgi:hypothetical protein